MSGNWVMGSLNKASTPTSTIINDITRDRTGLLIKVSTIYIRIINASLHLKGIGLLAMQLVLVNVICIAVRCKVPTGKREG